MEIWNGGSDSDLEDRMQTHEREIQAYEIEVILLFDACSHGNQIGLCTLGVDRHVVPTALTPDTFWRYIDG